MKAGADGPSDEEIRRMTAAGESSNKNRLTIVNEKQHLNKAVDILKSPCGGPCESGKGIWPAIPLGCVAGLPEGDGINGIRGAPSSSAELPQALGRELTGGIPPKRLFFFLGKASKRGR